MTGPLTEIRTTVSQDRAVSDGLPIAMRLPIALARTSPRVRAGSHE